MNERGKFFGILSKCMYSNLGVVTTCFRASTIGISRLVSGDACNCWGTVGGNLYLLVPTENDRRH